MTSRSPLRTAGAILIGAALTLGAAAVLVLAGVVQLPKFTDSRSSAPTPTPISTVAPPATKSGSLSSLYKQVSAGVAFVEVQTGQGTASGSGFLIDNDGHIVTNEH